MTKRECIKYLLIFIMMLMLHAKMVISQNLISADPSDTFDRESIFTNPAVIPFQHRQVMIGMKVYQLGFLNSQELGLRAGYFSFSLPEACSGLINLGFTGQNFSVPLYDQTNFAILIAQRLFERVSIGVKYNVFTKSYHKRYFDLVDPNDPVFADGTLKFAHSIGAGVIFFPWSTLVMGFACDHLNRPDVSLFHDNYKQPLVYDFGFRYSWRYFSSSLYFNYLQQHWQWNWIFETRPAASTTFKLGFVQRAAKFDVQFNIFEGLSINYVFDYPFYEVNRLSSGSHQINFIYDLDHRDRIKELQFTSYDKDKFPIFNLSSQFFIEIQNDKLEIVTQKIVRTIAEEIPESALKNLTEIELVLSDTILNMQQLYGHGSILNQNLNSLATATKYSPKYEGWLAQHLLSKKIDSLRFITDLSSVQRASDLREHIVANARFLDQHINIKQIANDPLTKRIEPETLYHLKNIQFYNLKPESVSFHISAIKMRKYQGTWKLVITDYLDNEVKTFAGKGRVPEAISWDWRNNDGILIKPDVHKYYFYWEDKNGKLFKTQPKMFSVTKVSRTLNIDIRSRPDIEIDQGRVVEIKFVN